MTGEEWTEADVTRLLNLREKGLSTAQIAVEMGRTESSITTKLTRVGMGQLQLKRSEGKTSERKRRDCLMCEKPFMSHHRGVRFCDECKNGSRYQSARWSFDL